MLQSQKSISTEASGHIQALRARHHALEEKIHKEQSRPAKNSGLLRKLKIQKLKLKEQIIIKEASDRSS